MGKIALRFILEKLPIFKQLNGYKALVSRIVLVAAALSPVLHQQFPELPHLDLLDTYTALVAGWLGLEVAKWHDKDKDERGL